MIDFQILHTDPAFVVVIKPPRVKSTDEPGGVPDLCRAALGGENFRTVHRLDQVVSGLMVLARTKRAASDLSAQIRDGIFYKEYAAVLHGCPDSPSATLRDLLWRSKPERKTYVVTEPGKDVQEAILNYEVLAQTDAFSACASSSSPAAPIRSAASSPPGTSPWWATGNTAKTRTTARSPSGLPCSASATPKPARS